MAEGELTTLPIPKKVNKPWTRRKFLKWFGATTVTAALGGAVVAEAVKEGVKLVSDHIVGIEDRIENSKLLIETAPRNFDNFLNEPIKTSAKLRDLIAKDLQNLDVEKANVLIMDLPEAKPEGTKPEEVKPEEVKFGTVPEYFPLGSQLKPIILLGIFNFDPKLITEENASRILTLSDEKELLELVDKLPPQFGASQAAKIHNIMKSFGVPLNNEVGTCPQMGSLKDLFNFYVNNFSSMPDVIKKYLDPTRNPKINYGLSNVLFRKEPKSYPYFKLGLWNFEDKTVNNSYMILIGNLLIVGYAAGRNRHDVHMHMVQAGARAAAYANSH